MEDGQSAEFLAAFVPWSVAFLTSSTAGASPAREAVLEVISTFPGLNEAVRPYLNDVLGVLIRVLNEDGEQNGLAAMHTFMELHKVFRGACEASVQPFIDFVLKLLESFPAIASSIASQKQTSKTGTPASQSVKLIIECPVMVVLLFQLHRRFINDNILKFVPLIMKILEISLPVPNAVNSTNSPSDDLSTLCSPIKNPARQAYCDFIQAKVKVLSFLAYVSRSFSSALKAHQSSIPLFILDILKSCPPESASARKVPNSNA